MAGNTDSRQLQLQISASAELLIRNLKTADNAVASFQQSTNTRLSSIDGRFEALGALKGKLGALDSKIGVGDLASAATGVTLVALAKRGLDYASSLGEVSQQLGITTRDLQVYSYAASQAGIDQETMEKALAKLTVTMGKAAAGAKEPTKAFNALGISTNGLDETTAGQVLPQIAAGLSKIESPAKRAAIEVALFGKAGQKLDTLLAGGRGQIDDLAQAAERLGLVLSDEQIQSADAAADKLSEVKQVLEANIAGVVADNANAILALASATGELTSEIIKFLGSNPQAALAIIGGLAGARVGGLYGAAIGAVAGYAVGERVSESQANANGDVAFRVQALRDARDRRRVAVTRRDKIKFATATGSNATRDQDVEEALAEEKRQQGLLLKAVAAAKAKATPVKKSGASVDIDGSSGSKSNGSGTKSAGQIAREAASAAKKDRADQRRAGDAVSRADLDVLSARADLSDDPEERLQIERQRIDLARAARDQDLDELAIDNKYVAASLDRLKAANAVAADADKEVLTRRRQQQVAAAEFDRQQAASDDAIAIVQIQAGLAVVAKDRFAIERRLLALRQQQERNVLDEVLGDTTGRFSPDERAKAEEARARLPERQAVERTALEQGQQGPLASYRDRLKAAVGDTDEALEGVAVNGLQSLEDGLVGVITGTESVAGAFKKMAASIISDLIRIAVQKAIVGSLTGGFFGFSEGGSLGDIPGRATGGSLGGLISGPGTGTSDSILALLAGPGGGAVRLSDREFIMNAAAVDYYGAGAMAAINGRRLPRFATGGALSPTAPRLPSLSGSSAAGGAAGNIMVRVALSDDLHATIDNRAAGVAVQVVRSAAPQLVEAAKVATFADLRRPSL